MKELKRGGREGVREDEVERERVGSSTLWLILLSLLYASIVVDSRSLPELLQPPPMRSVFKCFLNFFLNLGKGSEFESKDKRECYRNGKLSGYCRREERKIDGEKKRGV